jgi:hypothetical protein
MSSSAGGSDGVQIIERKKRPKLKLKSNFRVELELKIMAPYH